MGLAYNTWIVLIGVGLLGANAGLVGSFAVLRGRALTGDALAHAALPGLCLGFLVAGQRSLLAMLLGALATGLLGVAIISGLRRATRVKEDAAIGIVLSVFFGAGIAMSGIIQKTYAGASKAGLDTYIFGKTAGILASDVAAIAAVSLFSLVVIGLLFKEFGLTVFDPAFGRVQGWPVQWLDLGLMGLVAIAVVAGLPAVGVVLMAAMLILPGASARFWTDRLGPLLVVASGLGLAIGVVGTAISAGAGMPAVFGGARLTPRWLTALSARFAGMPAGPILVLVGAGVFMASAAFAPRRGLIARSIAGSRFRRELDERKLLRILYDAAERDGEGAAGVSLDEPSLRRAWNGSRLRAIVSRAMRDGSLRARPEGGVELTGAGLARAARIARGHRLWEQFLVDHPELAGSLADLGEESVDDRLVTEMVEELEDRLGELGRWPRFLDRPARWGAGR